MMNWRSMMVAAAVGAWCGGTAFGAVFCQKKSGAVFVRPTACTKKEGALDLAALGLVGPKGDPGPTASSFASAPGGGAIGGAASSVVQLTTTSASGGALHTTFAGRVVVTGSVVLSNHIPSAPNAYSRESCQAQIQAVGAASWTDVGTATAVDMPYSAAIDAQVSIAVVAVASEPAGDYDVRVVCTPEDLADQIHFNGANLSVVAVAS